MSGQEQSVARIELQQLLPRVEGLKQEGYRLVQVDCVRGEGFELNYSFAKELQLLTLRVLLPADAPKIPSIGGLYFCGALYENELHDLFGVQVQGLSLDYKGTFYRTRIKTPYNVASPPSGEEPGKGAPTSSAEAKGEGQAGADRKEEG
jgi:ech hydrogenase subunit D